MVDDNANQIKVIPLPSKATPEYAGAYESAHLVGHLFHLCTISKNWLGNPLFATLTLVISSVYCHTDHPRSVTCKIAKVKKTRWFHTEHRVVRLAP